MKEFRDRRVRQAIDQAINKKGIVDALYGGTGMGAKEFQPPAPVGVQLRVEGLRVQSPAGASSLKDTGFGQGLKEITWEDGKRGAAPALVHADVPAGLPEPRGTAEAIAAKFAKSGITVHCRPPTGPSIWTSARTASSPCTCSGGPAQW